MLPYVMALVLTSYTFDLDLDLERYIYDMFFYFLTMFVDGCVCCYVFLKMKSGIDKLELDLEVRVAF